MTFEAIKKLAEGVPDYLEVPVETGLLDKATAIINGLGYDKEAICALPHPNFEEHWSPEWQQRYRKILMAADYVKEICPVFSMSSYQVRNEWMVNHSSLLIAVYNGRAGGTRNTIEYANKCHVEVHMLYIHE